MNCLHCGNCCIMLDVVIINSKKIKNMDGSVDLNDPSIYEHKPTGFKCPNLLFVDGTSHCTVHHLPWFKETPCHDFTQIEREDSNCRTGEYMLKEENSNSYKRVLEKPYFAEAKKEKN